MQAFHDHHLQRQIVADRHAVLRRAAGDTRLRRERRRARSDQTRARTAGR